MEIIKNAVLSLIEGTTTHRTLFATEALKKAGLYETVSKSNPELVADPLQAFIKGQSKYFSMPATLNCYGTETGGLATHGLVTYYRLMELIDQEQNSVVSRFSEEQSQELKKSAWIALVSDLYKWNHAAPEQRNKKVDGKWEEVRVWGYHSDGCPFGQSEKTVYMIQQLGIKLSRPEALALRWARSAMADIGETKSIVEANKHPLVSLLADAKKWAADLDPSLETMTTLLPKWQEKYPLAQSVEEAKVASAPKMSEEHQVAPVPLKKPRKPRAKKEVAPVVEAPISVAEEISKQILPLEEKAPEVSTHDVEFIESGDSITDPRTSVDSEVLFEELEPTPEELPIITLDDCNPGDFLADLPNFDLTPPSQEDLSFASQSQALELPEVNLAQMLDGEIF